jgi:hypothetical protein
MRCGWPTTPKPAPTPGWRRATPPWSNCSMAAACASANSSAWTERPLAATPSARRPGLDRPSGRRSAHVLRQRRQAPQPALGNGCAAGAGLCWLQRCHAGSWRVGAALFLSVSAARASPPSRSGSACASAARAGGSEHTGAPAHAAPFVCQPSVAIAVATCARCRSCWATPASPRHRSIPGSTTSTWPRCTTRRTHGRGANSAAGSCAGAKVGAERLITLPRLTLPLFRVALNPRFTRPFYAVPRTSAARTASG